MAAEICQYTRETGVRPGRNCFAACGVGGRGANDDSRHRQAVRWQRTSGRWSRADAHELILWIVQATGSERLMQRSWRGSRQRLVWLRPRYVAIFRQLSPWLQIIRSQSVLSGSDGCGHGGLLLAAWCLALPSLPESRPVLVTFSHPDRAVHLQVESTLAQEILQSFVKEMTLALRYFFIRKPQALLLCLPPAKTYTASSTKFDRLCTITSPLKKG